MCPRVALTTQRLPSIPTAFVVALWKCKSNSQKSLPLWLFNAFDSEDNITECWKDQGSWKRLGLEEVYFPCGGLNGTPNTCSSPSPLGPVNGALFGNNLQT